MKRAAAIALAVAAAAAQAVAQAKPAAPPASKPQKPVELPFRLTAAYSDTRPEGDFTDEILKGGFTFVWPSLQLEIRGDSGILRCDRDTVHEMLQPRAGNDDAPRRGIELPPDRRQLSPDAMHARLAQLLRALGKTAPPLAEQQRVAYQVPRLLYFEGDVLVFRAGQEVARCRRLWISPEDDRMVVEGAELRYRTIAHNGLEEVFVVRGERMVKQGPRWTGRDLSFTPCDAGAPHSAVVSGELELVESDQQFEVWSRGNTLQVGGSDLLPLPDAHFFTGEQNQMPLKGAALGYSGHEGVKARVQIGMPWNRTGGALHEWLTGRPANEFRGDWDLDLGWIEKRGSPLGGDLTWRAKDLYEGRIDGFYMDDDGPNRKEIVDNIDGSPIDERYRNLVQFQNRVRFGGDTHLDVTAFHAGDPAVYSEFFNGDYHDKKLPETSAYLHHGTGNVLFTLNGRFNFDEFSYQDNRALAPSFVEELPVATLDLYAQPIATTPWDTPLVLDAALQVGERQLKFDPLGPLPHDSDRTLRIDQLVELSAPFLLGPVNVRPFANALGSWYDTTTNDGSESRIALAAGVRAGTRFSRTWNWLDDDGHEQGLRHVIAPMVTYTNRYHVSDEPSDFHQFDAVDALTEQELVKVEVRNLLQRMEGSAELAGAGHGGPDHGRPDHGAAENGGGDHPVTYDFLFLDLAQDIWPDPSRDHGADPSSGRVQGGGTLGLFYYDLRVRPRAYWLPFDNFAYAIYGEHDWQNGLRRLDTEIQFGKLLGLDWNADYRRDALVNGAVGVGASTQMFGRWDVYAATQYDLDQNSFLHYGGGLVRRDHDWSIRVGLDYNPFDNQVSFRIDFEPRLPGQTAPRQRDWYGSQRSFQQRSGASY
jgi:hypothetical protein